MLKATMLKAFNAQINREFQSAYLFMAMSAAFKAGNLSGFAHWTRIQAQEKGCHALILFNHVCERGGAVSLEPIAAPPSEFGSPGETLEQVLERERFLTESVNVLMNLAVKESDNASRVMLQWFLTAQTEAEAAVSHVVARMHQVRGGGNALFMMNRSLGARAFTVPSPLTNKK